MRPCSASSSARTARRTSRRSAGRYRQDGGSRHPRPPPSIPSESVFCAASARSTASPPTGSVRNCTPSGESIRQLDLGLTRNRRLDAKDGLHLLLDFRQQRGIV